MHADKQLNAKFIRVDHYAVQKFEDCIIVRSNRAWFQGRERRNGRALHEHIGCDRCLMQMTQTLVDAVVWPSSQTRRTFIPAIPHQFFSESEIKMIIIM